MPWDRYQILFGSVLRTDRIVPCAPALYLRMRVTSRDKAMVAMSSEAKVALALIGS